ncbi:arginine/serine-rich protein PNISR isoform X2 [Ochlerotatus camptorhynchus]|uniref:arginine/serine-rich protein PNISR isoform X2 n=1 Tax=Ochlerotatus camptorhynchus TaxID=644619 RepID=UPI0031D1BFC3
MYGRGAGSGRGQNGSNYSARSAGGGGGSSSMNMAVAGGSGRMAPVKNYQTVPSDSGMVSSSGGAMLEGEWSSLNPSLYQNMSNEQVDWAALAQQWIQMKETLPADMVPAAPPPPIISENYGSNSRDSQPDGGRLGSVEEQGEAPMEVERDEDHSSIGHQQQTSHAWDNGTVSWQYPAHSEWRNPAWDSNWSSGSSNSNKAYDSNSMTVTVNPNATIAVANWQAKIARIYKLGDSSNSSAIAGTVQPSCQSNHQQQQQDVQSKRIPGLMDQVIKLDHDSVDPGDQEDDTTQTINDAKRKLLPAWIREGLEKMEREKQRQAEKEKEQQQRAELLQQRRQAELEALSELEAAKRKSKFESDSEEDEAEREDKQDDDPRSEESPVPSRSRDEILQELMIAVRKNLTEILLEVTNEEIALVAKETLAKTRRKAQALRKTGLATLTGGLGLGIYGDSDEEDESGSDNDRDDDGNSEDDEEAERALRNTIKLRQKEFEWTAREIEDQIAKEEAVEERKRREYEQTVRQKDQQHNASDEDDYVAGSGRAGLGHSQQMAAVPGTSGGKFGPRDGETQPVNDKLYAYKLGRSRDKRVSRFSDPKDTVRQTHITHVAIVNHKPGEVVPPLAIPKVNQAIPAVPSAGNVVSPPVSTSSASSMPLFPAAVAAVRHLEDIRRGSSVASETPSNASSSRASSSHRSGREAENRKSSHKSRKAKKHKRSRYSRSDDDDDDEDDRYSQHSRRSHSSEQSGYSRRRRSYSRDSRDDDRDRKYSYKSRDRSSSRSRDRYKSSKRRSRTRSRSSSRRRY